MKTKNNKIKFSQLIFGLSFTTVGLTTPFLMINPVNSSTSNTQSAIKPLIVASSELFDVASELGIIPSSDLPASGDGTLFQKAAIPQTILEIKSLFFPFKQASGSFNISSSPLPTIKITEKSGSQVDIDFLCNNDNPNDDIKSVTFCGGDPNDPSKNASIKNAVIEIKTTPSISLSPSLSPQQFPRRGGIQFRIKAQNLSGPDCLSPTATTFKSSKASSLAQFGTIPLCAKYPPRIPGPANFLAKIEEKFSNELVLFEGCGVYEHPGSEQILSILNQLILANAKFAKGYTFCPPFSGP